MKARQSAQVMVIFPVAVLMLLGIAAMAIDGGRLFLGRQELQKAAEAAALDGALAAALADPGHPDPASHNDTVQAAVAQAVQRNFGIAVTICQQGSLHVDPPTYRGESLDGTSVNGVYVHLTCNAQLTAAALIPGVPGLTLGGDAEAVLGSAGPAGKFVTYQPGLSPYARLIPPAPSTSS